MATASATRRAFPLLGGALVAAALVACAGTASPPDATGTRPEVTDMASPAGARDLILATTTSTQDSGLLDVLVPAFEEATGYSVKTVAVGSGQALEMGEQGNADVLLVHSPAAEKELVASGAGIDRQLVMHNSFLLVGPGADPAGIRDGTSAADALARIRDAEATFVSRGDDSGTHTKELGYWKKAGIDPAGDWYLDSGQGMAATLRIASEKAGYTLTDIATWAALRDQLELEPLLTADPTLLNPYHVIGVNPAQFPLVNEEGGRAFADFLLSEQGQAMIGAFGADELGMQVFVPDGGKTEDELVAP
jgi:tungstate transport system substrate-binding protein